MGPELPVSTTPQFQGKTSFPSSWSQRCVLRRTFQWVLAFFRVKWHGAVMIIVIIRRRHFQLSGCHAGRRVISGELFRLIPTKTLEVRTVTVFIFQSSSQLAQHRGPGQQEKLQKRQTCSPAPHLSSGTPSCP